MESLLVLGLLLFVGGMSFLVGLYKERFAWNEKIERGILPRPNEPWEYVRKDGWFV